MASRLLTDKVSESDKLPDLSADALNLFFLLIPHLSVHGKSLGDPYYVKGKVCPKFKRFTPVKIEKCLKEISDKTNVKWFRVNGIWYLHSLNYDQHQPGLRKDRAGKDTLPGYPGEKIQLIENIELQDNSGSTPGLLHPRKEEVEVGSRSRKEEVEVGSIEQVVSYLNTVLQTDYKPDSKKTRELIKARQAQGFTFENFKTVINKKASQWKNDPKMCAYLRPETLFGTKFESYLNERAGPAATGKTAGNKELIDRMISNCEEKYDTS